MLSKTDLLSALQCPRMLWLKQHRPDLFPDASAAMDRRVIDGDIVGTKAREVLGRFVWPPAHSDHAAAVDVALKQLADNPGTPAVEVPMLREGLYSRADALIPEGAGYVLRETKSSTFPLKRDKVTPGKPEEHHLNDVAIQVWTMAGVGLPIQRAELNLLDNQWRYPGNDNYSGLFRQLDVSAEVQARLELVPNWLAAAEEVVSGNMPDVRVGRQCREPYECPYQASCLELEPPGEEHPITLLPDKAGKDLARKLQEARGYTSLLQPTPDELTGKQSALYQRIQHAHRTGETIVEPPVREQMAALAYPRYYFDFEGIDLPVPRWAGVRPYEQVPFQWSCHVERAPGVFEHRAFIDLSGDDPSLSCIRAMLDTIDLDDGGPIIVYYQAYEKGRLEGFSQRHPEHAAAMNRYIERLVDLHPMVKENLYDPRMRGSFSIKKVLPVVAPDLNYEELEEVQEGTGAQVAYLRACFETTLTPERRGLLKDRLLQYCEQDTWAMVEVGYFLEGRGRPVRPASAQV